MSWKSDYSILKLFVNNRVITISDGDKQCKFAVPSIRDTINDSNFNKFLGLMSNQMQMKIQPIFKVDNSWEVTKKLLVDPQITNLKEFKTFYQIIDSTLKTYWHGYAISKNREILWNNNVVDVELWNEFIGSLRNGCGLEAETKEPKFANEAARKLWEQQQADEARIAQIRGENGAGDENLIKACLQVSYAIPSYSLDKLFDLSFSQFKFLQEIARNYPAYQIESTAYAMGNLKEAPAFFIK
jgi:hypothetical protein